MFHVNIKDGVNTDMPKNHQKKRKYVNNNCTEIRWEIKCSVFNS